MCQYEVSFGVYIMFRNHACVVLDYIHVLRVV